jgi:hypothetical protein
VHGVADVLRRLKLTSNVPAAPWLPTTLIANALASHDVVDPPDAVEEVDELDVGGALLVVADEWMCELHAAAPMMSDDVTSNAPTAVDLLMRCLLALVASVSGALSARPSCASGFESEAGRGTSSPSGLGELRS